MCKPNLRCSGESDQPMGSPTFDPSFRTWETRIRELALFSKTYMKISGGFSEIRPLSPQQEQLDFWTRADLMRQTYSWMMDWLDRVLSDFGASRIMFGSDWPVCNMGGGGNSVAWMNVSLFSNLVAPIPNPQTVSFQQGIANFEIIVVVVDSKAICRHKTRRQRSR
jgi:hypothetical protein